MPGSCADVRFSEERVQQRASRTPPETSSRMTLHAARDGHFPMEEQPETEEGERGGPRRRARGEQNSKVTGGQPAEPALPPLHHPPSPNAATDAVAECIPSLSSRLINKAKKAGAAVSDLPRQPPA